MTSLGFGKHVMVVSWVVGGGWLRWMWQRLSHKWDLSNWWNELMRCTRTCWWWRHLPRMESVWSCWIMGIGCEAKNSWSYSLWRDCRNWWRLRNVIWKNSLINTMPGNIDATGCEVHENLSFLKRAISEKETLYGSVLEFLVVVRSDIWKTEAPKNFWESIIWRTTK